MLFRMVSSVLRPGSSQRQFVKRIPTDLKARMAGVTLIVPVGPESVRLTISEKTATIRLSLRTSVPGEAKLRYAIVAAHFEKLWETLRQSKPVRLTDKQATALAGDFYRAWANGDAGRAVSVTLSHDGTWMADSDPRGDDAGEWEHLAEKARAAEEERNPEALEAMLAPIIDRMLLDRGIAAIDAGSRQVVLVAFIKALGDAFESRRRNAEGDYSPDPKASRFPPSDTPLRPVAPAGQGAQSGGSVSLVGLVDEWWREAKAAGLSPSTHGSYRNTVRTFSAFLGHDDALAVTATDVVAFKDDRLAKGRSPKTVNDSDIAGLRSIFGWAVANLRMPSNPADKVKAKRSRQVVTRGKDFTPEEARAILSHSLAYDNSKEQPRTVALKRWVPWLCAYTGARVGEIVQLRKEDVRYVAPDWIITITPEAGTVKDKEARDVVLHAHLVELGFTAFVSGSRSGHLFLKANAAGETRGVWQAAKNRLSEFAREVVPDKRVAPNHGWRHLFKTIGHEAGIEDSVLDGICGHAPASVGRSYGKITIAAQRLAFAKFPRFDPGA